MGVSKNKYYLFWTRFLVELNALNAIAQLFYLSRGLSTDQILYLGVSWSLATLIFEVPSGYLADKVGRKKTIMLGVLLNIVTYLLMLLAHGFWPFAIITALAALSFACFSGTDQALIYDSLRELSGEKAVLRVSGKYMSAARLSKIFMPALGAFIAQNLTNTQFNLLILVNITSSVTAVFTTLKLVEPNRFVDVKESELGVMRDSLAILKKNKELIPIIFNKILVFISNLLFWKIYQPYLINLGSSVISLGIVYFGFQVILALVYWNSDKIKKRVDLLFILKIVPILAIVFYSIFFFSTNILLICLATTIILTTGPIRDPYFTEIIQHKLKSYNRATSTSLLNFFKSVVDIPILLISGLLATTDIKNVVYVGISLVLFAMVFFPIKKENI